MQAKFFVFSSVFLFSSLTWATEISKKQKIFNEAHNLSLDLVNIGACTPAFLVSASAYGAATISSLGSPFALAIDGIIYSTDAVMGVKTEKPLEYSTYMSIDAFRSALARQRDWFNNPKGLCQETIDRNKKNRLGKKDQVAGAAVNGDTSIKDTNIPGPSPISRSMGSTTSRF